MGPKSDQFSEAEMNVPRFIGATSSRDHRSLIQSEEMEKRWVTSVEAAYITLEDATTQRVVQNARGTLGRRFKTSQQQLNHKQLATKFYSDTLFPSVAYLRLHIRYICKSLPNEAQIRGWLQAERVVFKCGDTIETFHG
jgi:hypothetical protein